ncbi:MAG: FAD-dependent thymidylate synthase [Acutalibacteraceae bacterium]
MIDVKRPGAYVIGLSSTNEEICAASGRISTQKGSALEIFEKSHDAEKNASLIGKVTRSGHTSTLEHCYYNLAFSNVSVVVEQFMIEFRLASFTVQSRRYVDFSDCGYYVPDFRSDALREKYVEHMDGLFALYQKLTEAGIPKEDARFVLPYCFRSNFFCSLNARELLNVLKSMIYGRGSKYPELKALGVQLYEQCRKLTPGVFTDFEKKYENTVDKLDLSFVKAGKTCGKRKTVLLSSTPEPEKVIARAALLENTGFGLAETENIISDEETVARILDEVFRFSRPRALEQAQFSFLLTGMSLACLTHLTRHRMQSLLVPEIKTCDRTNFIIPESLKADAGLLAEYTSAFERTAKLYDELLSAGADENDLVYVLLAGNTIDVVSAMNARELLLFFRLRSCTRAQWEIREYANEMLAELKKVSPVLFSHYGPSCFVSGVCPEGRFSCGKVNEMKEKYSR